LREKALLQLAILACLLETPLVQAQMLSAGYDHTCVIDAGGGVQCWGSNSSGQLGNGSFGDRLVPVRVKSLDSGVIAVAATSPDRSCALRSNGEVLCWGNNARGELGDGTTITRWVPTRVAGLGPVPA
jgi:alpha-tubulin suppressor-like RCC1 family protein